ncbi:hypothetical protein ACFQDN_16615 [Pseudomonas asuensis]|jgi:hypothetical protein|uniref:Uncharacterized protein n=1 Tax=Pseudomonas asuensis TaxID=1825787 RepID=A0ABQ2GM31_9PSED|nr:hypothetical protein [Pseudomonas asuensis]GGM02014.1 hypothetical protein GCM10009425_11540 [Pseudomonas asuensis]
MTEQTRNAENEKRDESEKPRRTEHAQVDSERNPPSPNSPDRMKDGTGYN